MGHRSMYCFMSFHGKGYIIVPVQECELQGSYSSPFAGTL